MKTINIFNLTIIVTVFLILAGCSDSSNLAGINTNDAMTVNQHKKETKIVSTGEALGKEYKKEIKLAPHGSFTFNESSTGFQKFYSVFAENTSIDPNEDVLATKCQDFIIYSSEYDFFLDCNSSGFNLKDIVIENTSSKVITVNVKLTGAGRSKDKK